MAELRGSRGSSDGRIGGEESRGAAQERDLPPEVLAYADLVLYNGKVLTADDRFTIAEAVATRDGKFLAIGEKSG